MKVILMRVFEENPSEKKISDGIDEMGMLL
ncbi:hypothetical protein N399_11760 [Bacillus licheniformis CG-B52]|jgi:hypothetical protein|nr:hypothetical protein N399_11760 [Bacillus licheniformis CG-B52]KUL13125.1 hypothetical protein LI17339_03430 [Bacillus licheniformis LMG 17339]